MQNFYKILIVNILIVCFSFFASAQHNTSSPYSRYGIGEIASYHNGPTQALGGASIAFQSPVHINFDNPASYNAVRMQSFVFQIGLPFKYTSFEMQGKQEKLYDANLGSFAMAFPITQWLKMSIGVMPYSYTGYKISNESNILDTYGNSMGTKESDYEGSGGINRLYWGNSVKFLKYFSAGYNANVLFGKIDKASSSTYFVNDNEFTSTTYSVTNSDYYKDIQFDLGLQYSQKVKEKIFLGAGLTYSMQQDVNCKQTIEILTQPVINSIGAIADTTTATLNDGKITLPSKIGIGVSAGTPKWLFIADYTMQDWKKAKFFDNKDLSLTTFSKISAGIEYTPDVFSSKFWDLIRYRIGGHYSKDYIQIPGNNENSGYSNLKDIGITFGVEIPLRQASTFINIGVDLGKRETNNENYLSEKYAIVHLYFSMHDIWFRKYKFF